MRTNANSIPIPMLSVSLSTVHKEATGPTAHAAASTISQDRLIPRSIRAGSRTDPHSGHVGLPNGARSPERSYPHFWQRLQFMQPAYHGGPPHPTSRIAPITHPGVSSTIFRTTFARVK